MKKINLKVNGRRVQVIADRSLVLLDLIRDVLGLTGTKQSCDRKGQCGACTVIANGRAVLSCLTKVAGLNGAEVITVEGLGTPDNPHLIQVAFVLAGAVQCGFCTPGMIMAAKALLDQNPDPTREDIKEALKRNLCRCTGYAKIIDAVLLAARFLRGDIKPEEVGPRVDDNALGINHPPPSAMIKACGTAQFTADIRIPGALELAALRSPHPHARILSVDVSEALKEPGVVGAMTAADIKGTNRLKYLIADRPLLCEDRVRYVGDPIVVLAAETRDQAVGALADAANRLKNAMAEAGAKTAACDAGVIINPQNVEGQLEGGMDMGVGYALREEYVAGQTKDWVTFKFPTMKTSFEMETILLQTPRNRGTNGAVGVGEMTMVPTAPAVINAIHNACGVWMTELPATPDKIRAALAADWP
jgi:aerobic-type carbon monoxide dehydrogenase small subunit (CoxS/CutS family)